MSVSDASRTHRSRTKRARRSESELERVGLRVTSARVKVLEVLNKAKQKHSSVHDIFLKMLQSGEEVGIATVYRALVQFTAAGLVIKHNFEHGCAVYELDQGWHHDHMMCIQCGKITEFVDQLIEERQERIAKEHGFKISDHNMTLYVDCQRKQCPNKKTRHWPSPFRK